MGHIFGVESPLMVEKLEQYNQVIEVLFLSSCPDLQRFSLVNAVSCPRLAFPGLSYYSKILFFTTLLFSHILKSSNN